MCGFAFPTAVVYRTTGKEMFRSNTLNRLACVRLRVRTCSWNKDNNVGLVVGATDADALARVRAVAPDLWILAPGTI